MDVEAGVVAAAAVPYLLAAAKSLGARIWERAESAATESTVRVGRLLVARLFGRSEAEQADAVDAVARSADPALAEVIDDVVASPDDAKVVAALEYRVRKALAASPAVLAAVHGLVTAAEGPVVASGERSVAVGEMRESRVVTGDGNVVGEGNVVGDGNITGFGAPGGR